MPEYAQTRKVVMTAMSINYYYNIRGETPYAEYDKTATWTKTGEKIPFYKVWRKLVPEPFASDYALAKRIGDLGLIT